MPLYAVIARQYFGQAVMGSVFGAATMMSSFGMALGPLIGGWVFDTFAEYAWLFVGSFAVGLGAVAMALAFPPLQIDAPRTRTPAPQGSGGDHGRLAYAVHLFAYSVKT